MAKLPHVFRERGRRRGHHRDVGACRRLHQQHAPARDQSPGYVHAPEEKPNRIVKTIKPASVLHIGMKQNMRMPEMKHCGVKIVSGP